MAEARALPPEQKQAYRDARERAWYQDNREHVIAKTRDWYESNKERASETMKKIHRRRRVANPEGVTEGMRKAGLKNKYGPAVAALYDQLAEAQGDVCEICGKPQIASMRLAVDHDHVTDDIRALLCNPCNAGLGAFKDNPALLRKAADYLERHAEHSRLKPLLSFTIP
jgi:hypothetical protein